MFGFKKMASYSDDDLTWRVEEYFDNDYLHSVQRQIAGMKKDLHELDFYYVGEQNNDVKSSLSIALKELRNFIAMKQEEYDSIPKVYVIDGNKPIDIVCRIDHGVTGKVIKECAFYSVDYGELRFMSGRILSDDEYIKSSADLILSFYSIPTVPQFGS